MQGKPGAAILRERTHCANSNLPIPFIMKGSEVVRMRNRKCARVQVKYMRAVSLVSEILLSKRRGGPRVEVHLPACGPCLKETTEELLVGGVEAHGWLFANNLGAGINGCSAVRDACARWAGLNSDSQVARQGAWRSKNGNGYATNNSAGAILSEHRCALCCIQT